MKSYAKKSSTLCQNFHCIKSYELLKIQIIHLCTLYCCAMHWFFCRWFFSVSYHIRSETNVLVLWNELATIRKSRDVVSNVNKLNGRETTSKVNGPIKIFLVLLAARRNCSKTKVNRFSKLAKWRWWKLFTVWIFWSKM